MEISADITQIFPEFLYIHLPGSRIGICGHGGGHACRLSGDPAAGNDPERSMNIAVCTDTAPAGQQIVNLLRQQNPVRDTVTFPMTARCAAEKLLVFLHLCPGGAGRMDIC